MGGWFILRDHLEQVLKNYQTAKQGKFVDNTLANTIRSEIPEEIKRILNNDKYIIKGSPGMGNWSQLPWIGVFNREITNSAQSGYYIVYLFKENMEGVYLSLNQGVTDQRNKYGDKKALEHLKENTIKFRKLNQDSTKNLIENISLGTGNYAPFYEAGNIYAKYYSKDNLPSEEDLITDLNEFLDIYTDIYELEKPEEDLSGYVPYNGELDFYDLNAGRAHIVRDIVYLISKNKIITENELFNLLRKNVKNESYWKAYYQRSNKQNSPKYNLNAARTLKLIKENELKITDLGKKLVNATSQKELFTHQY